VTGPGRLRDAAARGRALAATSLLGACLVAACGPAERGAAGITVDGAGRPVVLLIGCGSPLGRTALLTVDPASQQRSFAGEWTPAPVGPSDLTLDVYAPGSSWRVEQPVTGLQEGTLYEVGALLGATGDGRQTTDAQFTAADLRALRPGQVLTGAKDTGTPQKPVPEASFRAAACQS